MDVGHFCTRSVVTCRPDTILVEVARIMRDRHVGSVIVVDEGVEGPVPIGIVTDRDLVVQAMAKGVPPESLRAGDLLKGKLVTVSATDDVYDAIWTMRLKSIRRLPVVKAYASNVLVGVLTVDDVTRILAEALSEVGRIPRLQATKEEASVKSERDAP